MKFSGCTISFFGDSISTFEGITPEGFEVFYVGENAQNTQVLKIEDTWWHQVMSRLQARLVTNASYSGSLVSGESFPAGQSDERIEALAGPDGAEPELIVLYFGVNDFGRSISVPDEFAPAYANMLDKLHKRYPKAQIACCTILDAVVKDHPEKRLTQRFEACLEDYNKAIRQTVQEKNCILLDIAQAQIPYDSYEGTHPTKQGMKELADLVIAAFEDLS